MASDRATLPHAQCPQGPAATPSQDDCAQRAEDLQRMAKALAGRLRKARLDDRVTERTDPTPAVADPHRLPLSRPRENRVDVSAQIDAAATALGNALDLLGHTWTEQQ